MTEEAADINGHVTAAFVSGARLLDAETVRELSRLSPIRAPLRIVLEYTVIACAVVLFCRWPSHARVFGSIPCSSC